MEQGTNVSVGGIQDFIGVAFSHYLLPAVFSVGCMVFVWGIFKYYVQGKHDEPMKEEGKALMFYGLIVFFVMVSLWGIGSIVNGMI